MLTLYYAPGACSMAPHIALEETGAAYNAVEIDEVGGEHLTEVYRRIIGMLERALTIWTCLSAPGGGVTVNVGFRPGAHFRVAR